MTNQHLPAASSPSPSARARSRTIVASTVGTVLEWYDFNLYGLAAALVFGPLMFGNSSVGGTLESFATLGVGFFARPIGGFILGNLGDRIGRKPVLLVTFITMGLSCTLIGCLPTYQQIGAWAPVLLVTLRVLGGLAVGGEFAGAALLTMENTSSRTRGLYGALPSMGTGAGFVLATVVFALVSTLPDPAFLSWGWRLPFLFSVIVAVFGVVVRSRMEETPVFIEVKKSTDVAKFPLLRTFREHPGAILRVIGVAMGVSVWGYLIQSFVLSYGTSTLGVDKSVLLWAIGLAAAFEMATIPFWGWLSDRIGRRTVMLSGVIATILFVFPFYWLLHTKSTALIFIAIIIGLPVLKDAMFGPMAALVAEMFRSNTRYSGVSAGREIGTAIFGGTAPFIGTALIAVGGGAIWPLALYIIFAVAVTGCAVVVGTDNSSVEFNEIIAQRPLDATLNQARAAGLDSDLG